MEYLTALKILWRIHSWIGKKFKCRYSKLQFCRKTRQYRNAEWWC